ncbi:uncharacterized protein LOC144142868 [Haemaphysalis longicornis]
MTAWTLPLPTSGSRGGWQTPVGQGLSSAAFPGESSLEISSSPVPWESIWEPVSEEDRSRSLATPPPGVEAREVPVVALAAGTRRSGSSCTRPPGRTSLTSRCCLPLPTTLMSSGPRMEWVGASPFPGQPLSCGGLLSIASLVEPSSGPLYEVDSSRCSATPPPGVRQSRRVPHPWLPPGTFGKVGGLPYTTTCKDICNAVAPCTPWSMRMSSGPKMEWVPCNSSSCDTFSWPMSERRQGRSRGQPADLARACGTQHAQP